ncbi:MAG: ATP-binding protein [Candidatus Eremiobacteraeota bacterium]|nr:ATP-binding protein [Candidatus Eremiobacteraeota bacterium]
MGKSNDNPAHEGLQRETGSLEKKIEGLKAELSLMECRLEESEYANIKFLSGTAMEFVDFLEGQSVYRFIGEKLREITGALFAFVSSCDKESGVFSPEVVLGDQEPLRELQAMLGVDLLAMKMPMTEEAVAPLLSCKIVTPPRGIFDLAFERIPREVCRFIEERFSFGNVHVMGFSRKGKVFGSAALILEKGSELRNIELIEAFINQASIVLQRKEAEDALRRSEERFRLIFENALDAIIWMDPATGTIELCNRSAAHLLETGRDSLIGLDFHEIYSPASREEVHEQFRKLAEEGAVIDGDFEVKSSSGKHIPVHVTANMTQVGKKPIVQQIIRDHTERKKAQDEILRLNEELEQRVRERTADLVYANKELEAFNYSVSHDLRTPLSIIEGFSAVILDGPVSDLPDEEQEHIRIINKSAREAQKLIADLLSLSNTGRKIVVKECIELSGIVLSILDDLKSKWSGRTLDISTGPLPSCLADPALLRQVFVNLISNAIKFTAAREKAVIEIGSERQGAENVYFVKDNGIGFAMHDADRIFGVFERLNRPGEYEGSGVGLAIVQRIIERHGGRIWAHAEKDGGAAFYFTLPCKDEPPA